MAEIERKKQKIFAGGVSPSGNVAIYGSKLAGTPGYSSNIDVIQSERWGNGIMGATPSDKAPYVQDLNAIFYVLSKQLAYIFQAGVPEWNSQTEYFAAKSVVRYNGVLFMAVANSTNKTPTDTAYWMRLDYEEFNQAYVNLTDGYPLGKVLRYGRYKIRSLISNNKNAPTGTNVKISDSETGTFYWELVDDVAPGTVMSFAGSKIPNGWFLCNGAGKNANDYPFLFRMIGYTYGGAGDIFNVPDFRNKTFWGGDTTNVGTEKEAGLPNIKGYIGAAVTTGSNVTPPFSIETTGGTWVVGTATPTGLNDDNMHFDASTVNSIYKDDVNTVQPPAIQTMFIIKY